MLAVGDGVVEVIHKAVMGTEATISIDTGRKVIHTLISIALAAIIVGFVAIVAAPVLAAITAAGAIGVAVVTTLATAGGLAAYTTINGALFPETVVLPMYSISPEELFKGHILLFDVNIFNPKEVKEKVDNDQKYYYFEDANGEEVRTSKDNSAQLLKKTISTWYYALRNLAVAALMVVLIYIGIRMLFTSIAEEKAKYKQMMIDWCVAMCLVFIMHYIMVFANNFTESIVSLISKSMGAREYAMVIDDPHEQLKEKIKEIGMEEYINDDGSITYPTNLMGYARLYAQEQAGTPLYIGYAICFLILVIYTFVFLFTYAKRLLYVMFLTVIAPLVAISYPLDKIGDGKSQAFDMWLKEYIFNLIIQPFHLLLYVVLIGNAFDLAGTNIIYTLVAIGFMMPAEKFLRKMFGFNKAETPALLSGATGAAVTMTAISKLSKFAGKGGGSSQGAIASKNGIRTNDKETDKALKPEHSMKELEDKLVDNPNVRENALVASTLAEAQKRRQLEDDIAQKRRQLDDAANGRNNMSPDEYENNQVELDRLQRQEKERRAALGIVENKPEEMEKLDGEEPKEEDNKEKPMGRVRLAADKVSQKAKEKAIKLSESDVGRYVRKNKKYASLAYTGLKGATKFAMGGAVAGIGAAAGIASGDPSNVGRNAVAGLYAGLSVGEGINNRISTGATNTKQRYNDYLKKKDPAAYEQKMKEKFEKNFKNDEEVRKLYQSKLSLKNEAEIDKALDDAMKYQREGVNDNDIIIKAMKAEIKDKNGKKMNIDRADTTRIIASKKAQLLKSEKDKDYAMDKLRNVKGMPEWKVDAVDQVISKLNDFGN